MIEVRRTAENDSFIFDLIGPTSNARVRWVARVTAFTDLRVLFVFATQSLFFLSF